MEKHDRWDDWRYHCRQRYRSWVLWPANIPEKGGNISWNMKQVLFDIVMKSHFLNMMFHNTEKTNLSRKCFTNIICRQNHNGEVVDRSWLCFSPSQTCDKCLTCRLMGADTTKCAHFLIRKEIFDWNHALERLRSHEHSMEHINATITFSHRFNHYEELTQN